MTSENPIVANPLGWAQLQLLGGWRRLLALTGLYAGIVLGVSVLLYNAMRLEVSLAAFASGAMTVLFFLQAALMFLVAMNQVRRAIQRDFATDMITSHRLTNMSGHTAVLGYLTGSTAQVSAMSVVNWLACSIFAMLSGKSAGPSIAGTAVFFVVLGSLAVLCWTFTALVALLTRGKMGAVGLLIFVVIAVNTSILAILPGLDFILLVVRLGSSPWGMGGMNPAAVATSILLQLCFAFIFFLAAARRFARDDVPAFSPTLAYLLLAYWALTCAVAWRFWPRPGWSAMHVPEFALSPANQAFTSLVSLALVACLPIVCAAAVEAAWVRRRAADPRFAPPRPRRYYLAPLTATLVAFGVVLPVLGESVVNLFMDDAGQIDASGAFYTVGAFLCALAALGGLLRYTCSISLNAVKVSVLCIVVLWALPIFADLLAEAWMQVTLGPEGLLISTVSPVGTWLCVFAGVEAPVARGLCVQALIAALMLGLGARADRARLRRAG